MMGVVSGIVIIWLILSIAVVIIQKITPYGRQIYAIGINEQASRYSGIPTGRIIFSVYILSAVFAALAGYFLVGYTGTSFLDVGSDYNTTTIAAVVIGGTAITGGKGGYIGTFAGAIMMTVLNDFLTIVNIPTAGRQIAQGFIILALVLVYSRGKKHNQ
jgi:ribose transport system permease protein